MEQSKKARRALRRAAVESARAEAEWFFTHAKSDRSPDAVEAARKIQRWLDRLVTFHVGCLALRYTPRTWPKAIAAEFGGFASLVVRMECAAHPAVGGTTEQLEAASVARLEKMIAERGRKNQLELFELEEHACQHLRAATRAYARVRGVGPSVLSIAAEVSP
jgi:hypothetical protein